MSTGSWFKFTRKSVLFQHIIHAHTYNCDTMLYRNNPVLLCTGTKGVIIALQALSKCFVMELRKRYVIVVLLRALHNKLGGHSIYFLYV